MAVTMIVEGLSLKGVVGTIQVDPNAPRKGTVIHMNLEQFHQYMTERRLHDGPDM